MDAASTASSSTAEFPGPPRLRLMMGACGTCTNCPGATSTGKPAEYRMAKAMSMLLPDPEEPSARTGRIRTPGATPTTSEDAAMVPATWSP